MLKTGHPFDSNFVVSVHKWPFFRHCVFSHAVGVTEDVTGLRNHLCVTYKYVSSRFLDFLNLLKIAHFWIGHR